ncbi:MAG: hypothetical protein E6K77_10315 [Candidatus Eisenbacteria bacterium]|uniref:Uncharacterized protein n=1 Tax=Eiseniibacteriota bacterium TaxID=2212470 RepID=A0A538TCQ4_UNCEI|nr:MAG: hypothetical protein E6K77_10315 [Candidatus Eisenbacteria bacterium]
MRSARGAHAHRCGQVRPDGSRAGSRSGPRVSIDISIETSGARVVEELFEWIDFWTVAPKGTSAETFEGDVVEAQVPTLRRYLALPDSRRQFKFVIQTREDVSDAVRILDELGYRGSVVLQPEHERGDGRLIFEVWPWDRYPEARLIPQTHKIVGLH